MMWRIRNSQYQSLLIITQLQGVKPATIARGIPAYPVNEKAGDLATAGSIRKVWMAIDYS